MKTLLTIVIPVYNRATEIRSTLDSIYNQVYRPFKLVLVDNRSSDSSLQVMEQWASTYASEDMPVIVTSCLTPGAASARNAGLEYVDTPWVMFFDSDDTMQPHHVKRAVSATRSGADVIGWDTKIHFLSGGTRRGRFFDRKLLYNCILKGSFASQRYMARTEIIRAVGAWEPSVSVWDDIELGTRIISQARGIKFKRLKGKPTVDVYQSEISISGMTYHENSQAEEYALRYMACNVGPANIDLIELKSMILAANYAREGHRKDAHRLRNDILAHNTEVFKGVLLRFAYYYTRIGLPGISTLLKPFF